jgi:TPP-dependent pyruvate/acetoin dehydrogenase alpha subunit
MQVAEVVSHSTPPSRDGIAQLLLQMYSTMLRIRGFEETVAALLESGEIKTPCHLCIGQEAVAAGVCAALQPADTVWGNHRSHGHYLAKGGDLTAMMAEIFGRATGCSGGHGGSMHLVAPEVGVLGTVPIVAATVPLAVGAALAAKLRQDQTVSVAFFGDGAMDEGHVYESINLAALYRLPVIFVCENNFYASHMHLLDRRPHDNLYQIADFHGIPGAREDGNDVLAVYDAACKAVDRARTGVGPAFLEFRTFRWRGHVGPSWDTDVGIKRQDELKDWLPRDPIALARKRLLELAVPQSSLDAIDLCVREEMEHAVTYARTSPFPDPDKTTEHVFTSPNGPPRCAP